MTLVQLSDPLASWTCCRNLAVESKLASRLVKSISPERQAQPHTMIQHGDSSLIMFISRARDRAFRPLLLPSILKLDISLPPRHAAGIPADPRDPDKILDNLVLQPPLGGRRLEEPDRPPYGLGVESLGLAFLGPEGLPQLRLDHETGWDGELHRAQTVAEEVPVGVEDFGIGHVRKGLGP